jgi:single-strand DNA-binding protein
MEDIMSLNQAMIIGNVGGDPMVKKSQDGKEIVILSVATTETWKDKATGEKKERTEWHNVAVFNEGISRFVKDYVQKGSKVFIQGQLRTSKYQDKDGKDMYKTQIVLDKLSDKIELLTKREGGEQSQHNESKANGYAPQQQSLDNLDDEIPF